MCGIAGVVHYDGRPVDAERLAAMRDVMVNRGPDAAGLHIDGNVGLAHRRLSIIDLSEAGNQPMLSEDGAIRVVFNGEIYNFQELRGELEAKGRVFRSRSDTEVLLHGYAEWGEQLVPRLRGMFAFALWDNRRRAILLARDHFGKKPLFYHHDKDSFVFASDIKAVRMGMAREPALNPRAIDTYLFHLSPTQEQCIWQGIQKLPPAHRMWVDAQSAAPSCYWSPDYSHKLAIGEQDCLEHIDTRLRTAVKRRLVSDVPLGALLSGGVDSSIVTALMAEESGERIKTFSIGFEESEFSEQGYARQVADRYNTDHKLLTLEPDVTRILPALVWEYGEPFADSSAVPSYFVTHEARKHVTVALSGDGGDEQFGGYGSARVSYHAQRLQRLLPAALREPLRRMVSGRLPPRLAPAQTLLNYASPAPEIRHNYSLAFQAEHKAALYTDEFRRELGGDYDPWELFRRIDRDTRNLPLMDRNLYRTILTRLHNDYLIKIDVAAMKNSLELRSPLLDFDLALFSQQIDPALKNRGGVQKYLLKKLAERYLPRETIYRPKRGFELPIKLWLRRELRPALESYVIGGKLVERGWFRADTVQRLVNEHVSEAADHRHRLWALLWLEIWWRMFITREIRPGDPLEAGQ